MEYRTAVEIENGNVNYELIWSAAQLVLTENTPATDGTIFE